MRAKRVGYVVMAILAVYGLMLVPDGDSPPVEPAGRSPFVWDQDAVWQSLARRFEEHRAAGCGRTGTAFDAMLAGLSREIDVVATEPIGPGGESFVRIERSLFELAAAAAACPARADALLAQFARLRAVAKERSRGWDLGDPMARSRLYRLLYGGRAAVEEVLLQMPEGDAPALLHGEAEPSQSPAATVEGVVVRSGDVLVSRGGAPTSAFIARGNDYPGNFSHIALVHVDPETGTASAVESHIERGVVVSSVEDYLRDKKLRIMVLRLRADLPALVRDPALPHRAASRALSETRSRHIAYDFEMDHGDPGSQFCSEVASASYAREGITLWENLSSISSPGTSRWLSRFGVRHFETLAPSDLEYDPKLVVVAEWRDPEALFADHVDNAVIDAMLEGAEAGEEIHHAWGMLPVARAAKAWSVVLNLFGGVGPVPEGMSATVALRVQWLGEEFGRVKAAVLRSAERFRRQRGYRPPYWELVRLAREAR